MALEIMPARLPRNAFTTRNAARAGDWWRLLQDVAVDGASRRGWTPDALAAHGSSFVVREMTVVHHHEVGFGTPLTARTWVSSFQRRMLTDRQIEVHSDDRVVSAIQSWVHIDLKAMRVARADDVLLAGFPVEDHGGAPTLPEGEAVQGPTLTLPFSVWQNWTDPLGHVNHPMYVDWIDECIARELSSRQVDPVLLQPVGERVAFRNGVMAGESVRVEATVAAVCGDAVEFKVEIFGDGGALKARATAVRRLAEGNFADLLLG